MAALDKAKTDDRRRSIEASLDGPCDLPDGYEYIVEWLFEVGPVMAGGYGPTVLTFTEIAAWAALRKITLTDWDAAALRQTSTAYLSEINRKAK